MERIIPQHVQIETINGVCSARCVMCNIEDWTRKIRIMTREEFAVILRKFLPYKDEIRFWTLHGFAEPLLDKDLHVKVRMAKELGFRGVGFASNCTELDETCAKGLLEAGLDTIICSIDGARKETHEKIRVKTNFDVVVANVERFIRLRDEGGHKTRVMLRFIRQAANMEEWPEYKAYWSARVDRSKRDEVVKFDVHNWGDQHEQYTGQDIHPDLPMEGLLCSDVFERMFIFSSGDVAHCCADDNKFFEHGNVLTGDPIDIYNNEIFARYRRVMKDGKILSLKHCESCTIPRSRMLKTEQMV